MTRPRATLVKVKALQPAPWNPRTISKERFENLKRAITRDPEMLWHRPVLAIKDGTVYAGNMRLRAAIALGMSEVPAIVEPITLEQAKERALRDNGSWGEYDEQSLAEMLSSMDKDGRQFVGFDEGELERLLASVEGDGAIPDEDIDLTPPAEPESRMGDAYELGPHRLVVGDATDERVWRALMGDDRADAMWTDPPYGVDYQGSLSKDAALARHRRTDGLEVTNDDMSKGALAEMLTSSIRLALEHMTSGSAAYICGPSMQVMDSYWRAIAATGLRLSQSLVWVKQVFVMGWHDYHYQHEVILYGWKPGAEHRWYGQRDRTALIRDDQRPLAKMDRKALEAYARELEEHLATDVRRVDRPGRSLEHPTMKPPALIAPMLQNSTRKGQMVVDPFAGSGSTMVAAVATERRAAMIEIDPRYADVIIRRWENLSGETVQRPKRKRA